jgi:hypothetical protein
MSRKRRDKEKKEAHERTSSNGRRAAQGKSAAAARGDCRAQMDGRAVAVDQHAPAPRANGGKPASGRKDTNGGNGSDAANGGNGSDAANGGAKAAKGSNGASAKQGAGPREEPLRKGDMVVIRMRSSWELEGELRAINDEVVRIFDFAVCDVLRLRRKDIERIERLVDAE